MIRGNDELPKEGKDGLLSERMHESPPEGYHGLLSERNDELLKAVRLLLLLSRTEFSLEEKRQIAEESQSFTSWKLFTSLAVRHGVAALVWQNLTDLDLTARVSETERVLLEGLRFKSIARVSWIAGAAAAVCAMLEKEGIRVVLLKGLALEHTVYGSRGLRQMSDADLLVSPSDALRARDIIVRAGFRSMPLKSPLYKKIILDLGNHLPELHRGGISVDLHYRLFGPEAEEIVVRAIAESETIITGTGTFRVLPPVVAFLALVSHIYKHEIKGEFQLRLWVDIYLLLCRYRSSILTEELAAVAKEAGIASEARIVLTVMEQVWGIEIPGSMRARTGISAAGSTDDAPHARKRDEAPSGDRLQPDSMEAISGKDKSVSWITGLRAGSEAERAGRFMHDLMHPGAIVPISQREIFRRNLASLKRPGKKIIFILGDIFPSIGFMKRRYGCRTTFRALLFYPHRLGKLAWILGLRSSVSRDF